MKTQEKNNCLVIIKKFTKLKTFNSFYYYEKFF